MEEDKGLAKTLVLTDNERRVLSSIINLGGTAWVEDLSSATGLPQSTVMSVLELLKSKGLVKEESIYREEYRATPQGLKALGEGFPEEKLIKLLLQHNGELEVRRARELLGEETSIAIGEARKRGAVAIQGGVIRLLKAPLEAIGEEKELLRAISEGKEPPGGREGLIESLRRRGLVEKRMRRRTRVTAVMPLAKKVLEESVTAVARLTGEDIVSGRWRTLVLKDYNVEAEPPLLFPGERHFLIRFIDLVRRIMFEMGFTEVRGPIVVEEFWNFDALFQAQDHPSREIHDTFWVQHEPGGIRAPPEVIERTRRVHETGGDSGSRGWGGSWDPRVAARLILRTQTTSVTVRALADRPMVPFRIFTVGKVYRPDAIDARHLPEFYQLDGIMSEPGMDFSRLLGMLKEFFNRLGFEKVRFKPAYFPFTEPSVEGYVWMEGKGWVEVFGAGMFRPEILEIAGVEENVGAWGIGLDRIAMKFLEVEDIRLLYTRNVNQARELSTRLRRLEHRLLGERR